MFMCVNSRIYKYDKLLDNKMEKNKIQVYDNEIENCKTE